MIINSEHLYSLLDEFTETELQILAMEECAELQKEISKMLRNKGHLDNVCEEMAHVLICIDALTFVYGLTIEDIHAEIIKKGGPAYESKNPYTPGTAGTAKRKRSKLDTAASQTGDD